MNFSTHTEKLSKMSNIEHDFEEVVELSLQYFLKYEKDPATTEPYIKIYCHDRLITGEVDLHRYSNSETFISKELDPKKIEDEILESKGMNRSQFKTFKECIFDIVRCYYDNGDPVIIEEMSKSDFVNIIYNYSVSSNASEIERKIFLMAKSGKSAEDCLLYMSYYYNLSDEFTESFLEKYDPFVKHQIENDVKFDRSNIPPIVKFIRDSGIYCKVNLYNLYMWFTGYIVSIFNKHLEINEMSGDVFLHNYYYNGYNKFINVIEAYSKFSYGFDQFAVLKEQNSLVKRNQIYIKNPTQNWGELWYRKIYLFNNDKFIPCLHSFIENSRNNKKLDHSLIRFYFLHFNNTSKLVNEENKNEQFYEEFVENTRDYYSQKISYILGSEDYEKIINFLKENYEYENVLLENCLLENKKSLYKDVLIKLFVVDYQDYFFERLSKFFEAKNYKVVEGIYYLMKKIDEQHKILPHFEEYYEKYTYESLSKIKSLIEKESDIFIDTFRDIVSNGTLFISSFMNDADFENVKNKIIRKHINSFDDEIYNIVPYYIDLKYRKNISEDAVDIMVNDIDHFYDFIEEKDKFLDKCKRLLSLRLLNKSDVNIDEEKKMVGRLASKSNIEYSNKTKKMFDDIENGKELTKEYADINESKLKLSVQILTSGSWIIGETYQFKPSVMFENSFNNFITFYNTKYSGRKLSLRHDQCSVIFHFTSDNKKTYQITSSLLQLTILLEASKSKSSRTPDIAKLINLDIKRVQHEIIGLAKNKIILLNNKDEQHFIINNKFASNKLKIKINNTAKFTAEEKKVHDEELSKDRDFKIQAAIVRIMKMRKELEHSNLISEAINDIKGFKPDISSIKGNINILIEKEYLERDRKNKNLYRYLA